MRGQYPEWGVSFAGIGGQFGPEYTLFTVLFTHVTRHCRQTPVVCCLLFYLSVCQSFSVGFIVRWLGGSFAKLGLCVGLSGFANVPQ
jgi:hypothetical protein